MFTFPTRHSLSNLSVCYKNIQDGDDSLLIARITGRIPWQYNDYLHTCQTVSSEKHNVEILPDKMDNMP